MTNEEINPAVRQAEEILENAYAEARAEECPQGDQCPVHFRVDEELIEEEYKYARMITYIGDYVVITEDNRQISNPAFFLKALMGIGKGLPDRFETMIFEVGKGAIADVPSMNEALRYSKTHNDWDTLPAMHIAIEVGLESGLIDVSKKVD